MFNRESITRLLLRKPGAWQSRIARWTVLVLAGIGAGFLVWASVLHLMLWSQGYKDISVIGPLFLVQGIGCILIAVAIVAFRWLAMLVVGAGAGVLTALGLILSSEFGLFGFNESLSVPYAQLSLAVEFTAAFVLLVGACVLALVTPVQTVGQPSPVPTRI
jgi:hypothetical protein